MNYFENMTMVQSFLLQRDRKKKNDKNRERKEKVIKERCYDLFTQIHMRTFWVQV